MIKNTLWLTKIKNANKYYKNWETRFKCEKLEEYWEGHHWTITDPIYKPYVVNLIYAELKKKLANILYQNLEYELTPRPGRYGYGPEMAMQSSQLKQDSLNEIVSRANLDNGFNDSTRLAAMDSYFRFGVMEVGYAADWRNPKKKLVVTSDKDPDIELKDSKVIEDLEVPENERIFFKRIKASHFRVAISDSNELENCSWCGYYSYIYKKTLLKTKAIKLPENFSSNLEYDDGYSSDLIGLKSNSYISGGASADNKDILNLLSSGKVCKVWNICDNEQNKRLLILEPSFETIWEKPIERLPFATHRHDFRLDGWYPIPPIFQWVAPQDEVNAAREQMRNYRRRFTRKYAYFGIKPDEIEKFKNEQDGELIEFKTPNSFINPISNPEIGISITDALTAGRDDFNTVSGSSSDLNTVQADRTTATQSKITAMKSQVIESVEQLEFTKFYKKIGRLALIEFQENFSSGMWIKNSINPNEQFLGQIMPTLGPVFQYITAQDLSDGFDIDIEINCINGTPQRQQEEFDKFIKFLTITAQFPQISLSPVLIREAAYRVGYRNEKVIAELQRTALLHMIGTAQNAAQSQGQNLGQMLGGPNANNGAQGNMLRNASPASQEVIDNQLINQ